MGFRESVRKWKARTSHVNVGKHKSETVKLMRSLGEILSCNIMRNALRLAKLVSPHEEISQKTLWKEMIALVDLKRNAVIITQIQWFCLLGQHEKDWDVTRKLLCSALRVDHVHANDLPHGVEWIQYLYVWTLTPCQDKCPGLAT